MVMIYGTLILAVVALVAPLFGKLANCELEGRPLGLVEASGLFFLLTVAFSLLPFHAAFISSLWYVCSVIAYFIGWTALLVGAFWQLGDVLSPSHARSHG